MIVAIDGPAGAGKSTVARAVARQLGFTEVNTGAIYRAVTLLAIEQAREEPDELQEIARTLVLQFEGALVLLDGKDVTRDLRSEAVNKKVSQVAAVPAVRTELLGLQRQLARAHPRGAVLEGRDVGTVVFPDAEVKIFLTASAQERARRRYTEMQFKTAGWVLPSITEVQASIERRDALDGSRVVAPLRPADDATVIDNTNTSLSDVVTEIVSLVRATISSYDAQRSDSRH
ncbi:MAG: (d)CMP kinase [Myxococcales bacterium]|nr:(d)CMP kinase [Myxococcales bacterium]